MFEKEALYYGYHQTLGISVSEMKQSASDWREGAEFGYNQCKDKLEYAKTIIQDLLNNSDEYARQRAMDFLKKE